MNSALVYLVLVDLIFVIAFGVTWLRLTKTGEDDPRLSRGLQLLQSKISILEDLSDQIERQLQQAVQLMEAKSREVQRSVAGADDHIRKIETWIGKSMDVAKIFQDRIPHEEIIDRKMTLKYIKAARLAHAGATADEIAAQVDLSIAEIEFIAKVNRDHLQFSEEDLPVWARDTVESQVAASGGSADESPPTLSKLGDQFREALSPPTAASPTNLTVAERLPVTPVSGPTVKKVVFPSVSDSGITATRGKSLYDRNLG